MEDQSPDKNIVFSAASASPISTEHTLEPATDPTVLIYSNAINMAVERLGNTLATTIGTAMAKVADSMQHMTAAFEKQNRQQVYSSYEDTGAVGALASRSSSQDGAQGKTPSLFARTREREAPRPTSEGGAQCDFKNHGSNKPTTVASLASRHSSHSLTKLTSLLCQNENIATLGIRQPVSGSPNNNRLSSQKTRNSIIRFPKQNQGPVGKRSDRRRDYRGGRGYRPLTFVSHIFVAGQVRLCLKLWKTLTSDPYVLDIIQLGVKLDFIQHPPPPRVTTLSGYISP